MVTFFILSFSRKNIFCDVADMVKTRHCQTDVCFLLAKLHIVKSCTVLNWFCFIALFGVSLYSLVIILSHYM